MMLTPFRGTGRALALVLLAAAGVSAQSGSRFIIESLDLDPAAAATPIVVRDTEATANSRVGLMAFYPDQGWFGVNCYGAFPDATGRFRFYTALPRATKLLFFAVQQNEYPPCDTVTDTPPGWLLSRPHLLVVRQSYYKRTVQFAGYEWLVKHSPDVAIGPGPNLFCDSNVLVDAAGRLHLYIQSLMNVQCSAEVILRKPLGYGKYEFTVETPLAAMHPNAVLGMFTWSENTAQAHREIDIELSNWRGTVGTNSQFVVQPHTTPGQMLRFNSPTNTTGNVYSFDWAPNSVQFAGPGNTFTVYGSAVPSTDDETVRINLYWDLGAPGGTVQEMVISNFRFTPSTRMDVSSLDDRNVPARGLRLPTLGGFATYTMGQVPPQIRVVESFPLLSADVWIMPNWSTAARTFSGTATSRFRPPMGPPYTWSVTQDGATGTLEQRTIGMLYSNFLGRVPAPEERDFQLVKAVHQGTPMWQLASNFMAVPEFQNTGRFAAGLYFGLLCRYPDFAGWMYQRDVLSSGSMSQKQLVAAFLATPEGIARYGSTTNRQFVRLLYECGLGRLPGENEFQAQVDALVVMPRVDLAWAILNSAEFRAGSNRHVTAFLLYAALLNREPAPAEVQAWANVLTATPLGAAVDAFLKSPEFALALR